MITKRTTGSLAEGPSLAFLRRGPTFLKGPKAQKKVLCFSNWRRYIRGTKTSHLEARKVIITIRKVAVVVTVVRIIIVAIHGGGW
jgi:hypothetical protein